jgi:hypothetical protein
MHGMRKTTVYIPDDMKRSLAHVAAARGVSEAELIREALRMITSQALPPRFCHLTDKNLKCRS